MRSSALARLARLLITLYQRLISPLSPPSCRYYPSCSEYARLAFAKHGFWNALRLSFWRLLRCNPFSPGGVDHP
jgi:uncharacterized protein